MMKQYDVIVIGDSLAGRQIAADLAKKDKKVALVCLPDQSAQYVDQLLAKLTFNGSSFPTDSAALDQVESYQGKAIFESKQNILTINNEKIQAKKFVLATSAAPFIPPIQGLNETPYETPLSFLNQPPKVAEVLVVGAGPIGLCLAGRLQKKGTNVTLLYRSSTILPEEEPELSAWLQRDLESHGAVFIPQAAVIQTRACSNKKTEVVYEKDGARQSLETPKLILATGLISQSRDLGLEKQRVYINEKGRVVVDDLMRTASSDISAVGGVTETPVHAALEQHQSQLIVNNLTAPFFSQLRMENEPFPLTIPSYPPLARLGLGEAEAKKQHKKVKTSLTPVQDKGLIKLIAHARSGEIYGVHILAPHAEEMILYFNLAKRAGITLFDLLDRQHYPSPTLGDAIFTSIEAWTQD